MSTVPCNNNKTAAQTLFLGASVSSFNTSMGWGSQPSQCTVSLIEDDNHTECHIGAPINLFGNEQSQFSSATNFDINHYYDCIGDACYVNAIDGIPFNSAIHQIENKMLPGKVYYEFFTSEYKDAIGSKYWYNPDPGFFGVPTRIKKDGTYYSGPAYNVPTNNRGYDIIDTPVYFKMGDFSFGGLVQSWSKNLSSTGRSYTVTINSMQSLLSSCFIILDKFAGAIFSKSLVEDTIYGAPRNYTKTNGVTYGGSIAEGNLPNVFNVYGFLESLGIDGFGGSRKNKEGISANKIVDAITVLTSTYSSSDNGLLKAAGLPDANSDPSNNYAPKAAFSPFGRILAKCIQEQDTYDPVSNIRTFGVIPPAPVINAILTSDRCQFSLDLSELPRTPDDFRLPGPIMSILDLITTIADQTGHDFYIDMIPIQFENKIHNIIKIKTISRLKQPRTNLLENTIKTFECNQYPISATTIGKEKNETSARSVIIGGPQQRLYQAKSYRLAYTQANYIFNPTTYKFIDYMQLGAITTNKTRTPSGVKKQFHHGKIKFPNFLSTRNPQLNENINPNYSDILNDDDVIQNVLEGANFTNDDIIWDDSPQLGGGTTSRYIGNYHKSQVIKQEDLDISTWGITDQAQRFFPSYKDVICPFFGFVNQEDITLSTKDNNSFRRIRPVWFDTWTGQSVVVVRTSELPLVSVPLLTRANLLSISNSAPPYNINNINYCVVTESEMRAALEGFDNFLVYSLAKTYKPDLIEMLRRSHINQEKLHSMSRGIPAGEAEESATLEHDWYWRLQQGNIAGYVGQPSNLFPDKSDGAGHIPEKVLNDIKALHKFVESIGSNYGKKYMVSAQGVQSYKDEKYADLVLPTQVGNAYIFSGGGDFIYNYQPTNDGAWEEYGNIIDDSIAVGTSDWYTISDDAGKIRPILGYNASDYFDYIRYNTCKLKNVEVSDAILGKSSPFWSYDSWKTLMDNRDVVCDAGNFVFPSLDLSSLSKGEYVVTEVISSQSVSPLSQYGYNIPGQNNSLQSLDAWGNNKGLIRKKLYVPTTVDENFVYLNPELLKDPKILINAPGIHLTSSSSQYAKDPNRTVIANSSVEDLAIYLKVTFNNLDYDWIRYMLSYIAPVIGEDGYLVGNYAVSSNQSANHVTLSPKVAHPFFAGIPIKSNSLTYGPWTNYPYLEHLADNTRIFPPGTTISQSKTIPAVCVEEPLITTNDMAKKAIDNWIVPTLVEYREDFVPWNYGGCSFLDQIALNEIETKINYQNILETAQIDMVGLPMFDLGGAFSFGNINKKIDVSSLAVATYTYSDTKFATTPLSDLANTSLGTILNLPQDPIISTPLLYNSFQLNTKNIFIDGPIITNIQVAVSQQGLSTTYSFRTYTRKLGLFNKEYSDRVKFSFNENMTRNKQIADLRQQGIGLFNIQNKFLEDQRLSRSQFGSSDFNTKLYGWSPSLVLIGQASPYLLEPTRFPKYVEDNSLYSNADNLDSTPPPGYNVSDSNDVGDIITLDISSDAPYVRLSSITRHKTTVGLYERKEVDSQLKKDYGLQSAMSLDGLLSPVSFYPTLKNSTYHISLYDKDVCPFCNSTKMRKMEFIKYATGGKTPKEEYYIYCDKCTNSLEKLSGKLSKSSIAASKSSLSRNTLPPYIVSSGNDFDTLLQFNSLDSNLASTSSSSASTVSVSSNTPITTIRINAITLNPIVVPYGEFKNYNVQQYSSKGEYPNVHKLLPSVAGSSAPRPDFMDRQRHSIEIVARGATPPTSMEISRNLRKYKNKHNTDFYHKDLKFKSETNSLDPEHFPTDTIAPEMNQRFMGLRGPLVMHAWGYDNDGYPVPNAADEPYQFNLYNEPKRFKQLVVTGASVKFGALVTGDGFIYQNIIGIKTFNNQYSNKILQDTFGGTRNGPSVSKEANGLDISVNKVTISDDMSDPGGWGVSYQGNIISKTQEFSKNTWSSKKKMQEFYLNWAERPELWPVGPIDLRWDDDRKVWSINIESVSAVYKFVYVTLEEDLVKEDDFDETYPARGFLDDIDYAKEPLPLGTRRLVYIKDRAGYTAPRGVKLLCRYDSDSGFYEPISKPSIMANGTLGSGNSATIEMTYIQGRMRGEIPTMLINYNNKFKLVIIYSSPALFTYISGEWVLLTVGNP